MQLKLAVVALERPHLNQGRLFQVVDPQLLVRELVAVLHHLGEGVDQINHVVALLVDDVDLGAGVAKLLLHAEPNHLRHQLGVRLVAHLEHAILVDLIKAGRRRLEVVQGVAHVTLSGEQKSLVATGLHLEAFSLDHLLEPLQHLLLLELCVAHDGAAGLDGLDQLRAIIARKSESSRV